MISCAWVVVLGLCDSVELDDDLGHPGRDLLEVREGPLLERLGEDGVVGVGDHVAHDVDGLVEADAVLGGEQTDELGHTTIVGCVSLIWTTA